MKEKERKFVANCCLCQREIFSDEIWTTLHGRFFFCKNEELAKLANIQEKDLIKKGLFNPLSQVKESKKK
jgi:hypothetical protein